jgi:hypothetical protein
MLEGRWLGKSPTMSPFFIGSVHMENSEKEATVSGNKEIRGLLAFMYPQLFRHILSISLSAMFLQVNEKSKLNRKIFC